MADVPVVGHLLQMVMDLASRPQAGRLMVEEGNRASGSESPKNTPQSSETTDSDDLDPLQKRPVRIYRVGHSKRKRRRVNRVTQPSQRLSVERSRVDISLGGIEPFCAFDLPQGSTTDLALHHWVSVVQNSRMPINPRRAWMKINLSDKTLLSVTTYSSAYHYYFIRGMRPPPSSLFQKVNAIRNINKTLQTPGNIPTDYTMVAVAVMTILEVMFTTFNFIRTATDEMLKSLGGEPTACYIHRKGLQLMIQSRGGLQNLGFDGAAQRTISWADTCCANLLRVKPSLSPFLIPDAREPTFAPFDSGDLQARLLSLSTLVDLTRKIIYIWARLRYLTVFLTRIPDKSSSQLDDCFFSDKIDFIERQTLALLHSDGLAESGSAAFLTAFLNASLIYIYEDLRECPKWSNISVCLSQRIYSGLQMVNLTPVTVHCPDMLLWIFLLGRSGNSPLGVVGKTWFVNQIACLEKMGDLRVPRSLAGLKYFELAEGLKQQRGKEVEFG